MTVFSDGAMSVEVASDDHCVTGRVEQQIDVVTTAVFPVRALCGDDVKFGAICDFDCDAYRIEVVYRR